MKKSIVLGNGESRKWFNHDYLDYAIANIETWGCNAIYRDGRVNNLVAMDYAMHKKSICQGIQFIINVGLRIGIKYQYRLQK